MRDEVLVELADGSVVKKLRSELLPEDIRVVDGPGAFDSLVSSQQSLEAEISSAGGFDAWREANRYRFT